VAEKTGIKSSSQVFQYIAPPIREVSPAQNTNLWNPTAPSPTRNLPPMLKIPNSEGEEDNIASTGRRKGTLIREIFYPGQPVLDSGRRGSSLDGPHLEETTPL